MWGHALHARLKSVYAGHEISNNRMPPDREVFDTHAAHSVGISALVSKSEHVSVLVGPCAQIKN